MLPPRGPTASVPPEQSGQPSLDLDLLGPVTLRIVLAVGRIEPDHLAFAAKGLERRFLIVDERDHDLAVAGRVLAADKGEVAVQYALIDHRIAGYFERIMLARAEQGGGDGEGVGALQRLDRRARRDPAVERQVDDRVVGGGGGGGGGGGPPPPPPDSPGGG
jgi:hypothetical protein